MSSDSDSEEFDVEAAANQAKSCIVPEKSKLLYDKAYDNFLNWLAKKKITVIDEKALLAYFGTEFRKVAPSTRWSRYSMLKLMLNNNKGVNISTYANLIAYLKNQSKGHQSKKSAVFEKAQVVRFLLEADNKQYLVMKVALIIGICGALRRKELTELKYENVKVEETCIGVLIEDTKNNEPKSFVINQINIEGLNFIDIVRQYMGLRPEIPGTDRFFLTYKNDRCIRSHIGINTIGNFPKLIAQYLGLDEPAKYTGHAFRRSAATFLADSGADITTVKRLGGWKSTSVAEGYIADSLENKKKIAQKILGDTNQQKQVAEAQAEAINTFAAPIPPSNYETGFVGPTIAINPVAPESSIVMSQQQISKSETTVFSPSKVNCPINFHSIADCSINITYNNK